MSHRILCTASSMALAALLGACAGPGVPPSTVAVLPLDAVGRVARQAAPRARRGVSEHLSGLAATAVVPASRVDRALAGTRACHGQERRAERCPGAVGRAVGASHVVSGALGAPGETYILQLRLADMRRRASRSTEETLGGPGGLNLAVRRGMDRLFQRPPRPTPWYRRWYTWTAVGLAVTAAVVIPIAVQEDDPYEDVPLP